MTNLKSKINKEIDEEMRRIDEHYADPSLLEYDVICHRCQKKPIDCKCSDKWMRLHQFHFRLLNAQGSVCLGYGNDQQRKLTNKFGF